MNFQNYDNSYIPTVLAVPIVEPSTATSAAVHSNGIGSSCGSTTTSFYGLPNVFDLPEEGEPVVLKEAVVKQLKQQGFTIGLAEALSTMKQCFPLRIWILDNSGSMQEADGQRLVETSNKTQVKFISSTRWEELRECANYHLQLAGLLEAPTTFRLLNDPGAGMAKGNHHHSLPVASGTPQQQFTVADSTTTMISTQIQNAHRILQNTRPSGVTPLTDHILEIHRGISSMAPMLRARGQRVVITLATDGLPTDAQGNGGSYEQKAFVEALRTLEQLPIWLVIRLCTNEEHVVEFYNTLDEQLELSMEVLDDFVAEASEVHDKNPWLNYALPLHRMREFGFHDRILDMLDERLLTKGELRDMALLLFGKSSVDGSLPDPAANWTLFLKELQRLQSQEDQQWNPISKKLSPWINLKKLNAIYGDGSNCIIQ
jgi:hypothetical protein